MYSVASSSHCRKLLEIQHQLLTYTFLCEPFLTQRLSFAPGIKGWTEGENNRGVLIVLEVSAANLSTAKKATEKTVPNTKVGPEREVGTLISLID